MTFKVKARGKNLIEKEIFRKKYHKEKSRVRDFRNKNMLMHILFILLTIKSLKDL
jgi:hypothetical protein